jgi:hypothetical protein
MMKTSKKFIALLSGAALLTSSAFAQTVATTPVGYVTSTVYGNGGSGQRLTLVSPSFHTGSAASGVVSASTSSSVTASGALVPGAYDGGSFYIEVVDSSGVGYWTDVVSNTADTFMVNDDLTSFIANGDQFHVREHLTIAGLFGAANEAGLQAGGSVGAADNVQIISYSGGVSQNLTYWYSNVSGFEGWFDPSFTPSGDAIVAPHEGVIVVRKVAGDVNLVFNGTVRTTDINYPVEEGLNVMAVPSAATKTLDTSGLASAIAAGGSIGAADNIQIIGADGNNYTYWYSNVSGFEGWFDPSFTPSGNVELTPGISFILTRKAGNGGAVNVVMSSTLPDAQ